ncbi:hypothetical protein GLOIN_2v1878605 [Rhizophagus clarus]|uniref:Galactose oxidase n=1 Tax=Rhizophagus clarus TaxID=94130 RepID=A0A8H3L2A6_9GLOM|nr:hypothetical protein GLOIN_2v1878605 [Rhizophagus clarus]
MVYGQNFIPEPRTGHTAVLIEYKIYIIGGDNPSKTDLEQNPESDIVYLNIDPYENYDSWVNIQSQGLRLPHTFSHTANIGGINQDSIFIIGGGHLYDEKNTNYFYKFDTNTNELSVPVIQGKAPSTRIGMKSVSYEGKIYMFGGRTFTLNESDTIYVNQFDILDTINLNWQVGSLVDSPVTLSGYTATLVNETIYYIGGRSQQYVFSPMTEIFQYDIVNNKWSLKKATSLDNIPGPRIGHSAVLYDGKIFVYGGSYFNEVAPTDVPAKKTFVMLDTVTLVWSIPPLGNTNVPKLAYHTASLKGAMMTLNFGIKVDLPNTIDHSNNSTYFFYLKFPFIRWISIPLSIDISLQPSVITKASNTPTEAVISPQNMKTLIVGISVGSVIVVLPICVVCTRIIIFKIKKRKQTKMKRESTNLEGQDDDSDKYPIMHQSSAHQQFEPQQLQQQYNSDNPPTINE